jgi:predicted DNA-binding transcriptional regulator YafY
VRLRVSENLAKILRETPLAPKQQIKASAEGVTVVAAVRDTPALRRWILGHGRALQVLGPAGLRAEIRKSARAAAAMY